VRKVWVNGTFDVIHPGHIKLLQYAWQLGDYVCVGLDTDERIRKNKGSDRPIHVLEDRVFAIRSIKWVNEVVTFGTDDELRDCIKQYNPDIMVIGGDYVGKPIIGREYIKDVVYLPRYGSYSSTRIINNI
jgi:D-beta-D-heptose 7-phosphate kinase/D-beta-D-heptose 1-phosphate adenosyltransferase